jgi:HK97 family phage portal protein
MSIIKSFIENRKITNSRNPLYWLGLSGYKNEAGVEVTMTTAMRQSAVFACVNLLANTFACVPWITYKRLPRGKDRALGHRLYSVLHDRPNPEQSSAKFRATAMAHTLLYGNGYAEIEFDNKGLPIALWPIPAWLCKPIRTQKQELFYQVTLPDKQVRNLPPNQVWHFTGLSLDGVSGLSVIAQAREAIGLALATEQFGGHFFSRGANVGGVAQHPGKLSDQGHKNLQASLDEQYAGLGRDHRLMLLEEGMTYQKVGIPNNDSQFLETRLYQIVDIARMFHVPLHMINELTHATFTNIEHQGIEFLVYTMNPWFVFAEQETNYKLFGLNSGYFTELLSEGLLRGDSQARAAFYRELFYLGSLSPNEIREKENLNPISDPGGDKYYTQANMVPMGMAGKQQNSINFKALFDDAARRVAEREKQNISRAWKKSPDEFNTWLTDFYRDFPQFIRGILTPVFIATRRTDLESYIKAYVDSSRGLLVGNIESVVTDWEHRRVSDMSLIGG